MLDDCMNRVGQSVNNIIASVFCTFVKYFLPFITRTIVIYKYGSLYSGLGGLFSSVLEILNLSELGFESAITYVLYDAFYKKDNERICALLFYVRRIFYVVSTIVAFMGMVICPFIGYFIKGDVPSDISIYILFLIYLINDISAFLFGAYNKTLLTADQKTAVINWISTITYIVGGCFQIGTLLLVSNYYIYTLEIVLITVVTNLIIGFYAKNIYPDLRPHGDIHIDDKKIIIKKVRALMLGNIGTVIYYSFDNIVISMFIGLNMITLYNNYNMLITVIWAFYAMGSISIIPVVANKLLSSQLNEIKKLFFAFYFGIMLSSMVFFSGFTLLFQDFIELWLGKRFLLDWKIVLLITILFEVKQSLRASFTFVDACGMWEKTVNVNLFSNLINLLLNVILVQKIGLAGVVLSTCIAQLIIQYPWNYYVVFKYIIKSKCYDFIVKNIMCIAHTASITAVLFFVVSKINVQGIYGFIIKGIVIVFVNIVSLVLLWRRTNEYKYIVSLFKNRS